MLPSLSLPPPGPSAPARDAPLSTSVPQGELSPRRELPPVTGPGKSADPRFLTARERPVGPPPAFKVNLLDHIRETAMKLEAAPPVQTDPFAEPAPDSTLGQQVDRKL